MCLWACLSCGCQLRQYFDYVTTGPQYLAVLLPLLGTLPHIKLVLVESSLACEGLTHYGPRTHGARRSSQVFRWHKRQTSVRCYTCTHNRSPAIIPICYQSGSGWSTQHCHKADVRFMSTYPPASSGVTHRCKAGQQQRRKYTTDSGADNATSLCSIYELTMAIMYYN